MKLSQLKKIIQEQVDLHFKNEYELDAWYREQKKIFALKSNKSDESIKEKFAKIQKILKTNLYNKQIKWESLNTEVSRIEIHQYNDTEFGIDLRLKGYKAEIAFEIKNNKITSWRSYDKVVYKSKDNKCLLPCTQETADVLNKAIQEVGKQLNMKNLKDYKVIAKYS